MTARDSIALLFLLGSVATAGGQARHYYVSIPPQGDAQYREANFALWIPQEAGTLRGVILHQHGCGEPAETAGATATFDLQWQALAKKWDCALMGSNYRMASACSDWCFPEIGSEAAFLKALEHFAKETGREELARVPWVLWGHSGGAEWAYRMFMRHPERVLVLVLRSGPVFTDTSFTQAPETPVLYNIGLKEKDDQQLFGRIWDKASRLVQARRDQDALDTWAPDPQASHDCRFGRLFVIPYIDACLAQRLGPPGTALMGSMDLSQSWLGNVETFAIQPAHHFTGDASQVTWLPNERIASRWKEFVTTGWVTDQTPPPAPTGLQASLADAHQISLRWQAEADLDSGIKTFRIYRNGRPLADWNASAGGLFQKPNYHDTLDKPLSEMAYCDPNAPRGTDCTYEVTAVNWCDLESPKSAPVAIRIEAAR
jgi:pimeloyl-ACP methyl ester carboxylesterase